MKIERRKTLCDFLKITGVGALFGAAIVLGGCGESPFPIEARVVQVEQVADDVKMFHLRIERPRAFTFRAGQYLYLRLPDEYVHSWNERYGTDHQEVIRPYSLASSPLALPDVQLLVRRVEAPPGTDHPPGIASTFLHDEVAAGTVLTFRGPAGEMVRSQEEAGDLLLIAGGTGLAPMIGLLDHALAGNLGPGQNVKLFFGARDRTGLYFHDELASRSAINDRFAFFPALSDPGEGDSRDGFVGFIHLLVDREIRDATEATALIAGPEPMVRAVAEVLLEKGIAPQNLRTDNQKAIADLIGR